MSSCLEDPYKYTPKCFPFIDPERPYSQQYTSTRMTNKNREIEGSLVMMKQQYMSQIHQQNHDSEINMLKIRHLVGSLKSSRVNSTRENANAEIKCEIYGARRNKEHNLRRGSHDFPDFVKHREYLHLQPPAPKYPL